MPLRDRLHQRFGVPVVVENDVNLMALGEYFQGAGQGVANLALMHVSDGIGAGILIDGTLFRGARQAAGGGGLPPSGAGRPAAAQDYGLSSCHYSSRAIRRRLQEAAAAEGPHKAGDGADGRPVRRLRELAEAGVPWARALLEDALRHWAHALASITCILDPELVLLAGDAVDCGQDGLEEIRRIVAGLVPDLPEIRFAELGSRAALTGAVAMALSLADENAYGIEADQ